MPGLMLLPFRLENIDTGEVLYRGELGTMGPIGLARAYRVYVDACAMFGVEPECDRNLIVRMGA